MVLSGIRLGFVLAFSLTFLHSSPEELEGPNNYYFTLNIHALPFEGDLDGIKVLWHIEKAFYIPSLEKTASFSLGFGRRRGGGAWDVSLHRSSQDTFFPADGITHLTFYALDLTGRAFLSRSVGPRPYFLFGLSIPWLTVEDGAEFRGEVDNTRFIGMGVNLGGGFVLPLGPDMFLNASLSYRLSGFFYAWGGGKGRDVMTMTLGRNGPEWDKWLRASCLSASVGFGFNF